MSDETKSWLLRLVIVFVGTLVVVFVVALADAIIDRLSQHWTGTPRTNQIEIIVAIWLIVSRLWNWAERRVWIGTKAR